MNAVAFQATQQTERIGSLDFLRGIAILGILIINIETFSYPDPWSPYKYGFHNSTDIITRFWVYFLVQGKLFSMLSLLFGAGFYIFFERLEQKQIGLNGATLYGKRLLWLFVFGVIHAYLIWDGDILYHYAICGLLLFAFRSYSIKKLFLVLLIPIAVLFYNSAESTSAMQKEYNDFIRISKIDVSKRSEEEQKIVADWERRTSKKTADTSKIETPRKTYLASIIENAKHQKVHKGVLLYENIALRTFIMMILGIILYKSGVFRNYRSVRFYWPITISILITALAINYFRYYHWSFEYNNPVMNTWKGWLFAFPKETLAVAYVLLFNGLYQKFISKLNNQLISSIGQMALTNYIMQSIICGFIFYGYGLGKFNQYSRTELLGIVALIWCFQVLFSWRWFRKYKRGPLEALWRKLTYGKIGD